MLPISPLFIKRPRVGLEITSSAVRLALLAGSGMKTLVLSAKKCDLPSGMVIENYASPNIQDRNAFVQILGSCLNGLTNGKSRPVALSLPDSIFRVQTLEFDQLPKKAPERERLIRWRLEKAAAFDISDSLLRYEILKRNDTRFTVLACVAKQPVISQYEAVLAGLGLEPWSIGLSSFHTLNFYSSYITKESRLSALIHLAGDAFTTVVIENGGLRFYRFKEIKRAAQADIGPRLVREIEDSLHFYTHLDREEQTPVAHLYLTGESAISDNLVEEIRGDTSLNVAVLTPGAVLSPPAQAGADMAAALGAGRSL